MFSIIVQMLFNLFLTVVIEVTVGLMLKVRGKSDILFVVLINCVTNPILNYLMNLLVFFFSLETAEIYTILILLEIAVVISEGIFFRKNLDYNRINPLLLSVILNGSSFAVGELITVFLR